MTKLFLGAALPAGVPTGPFGPRLRAILAMRAGSYRLGKRPIQQLASDLFGLTISLGMISKLERRAAKVLGPVVGKLAAQVTAAPSAHINETSWPEATERMWLWVGLTDEATVFRIADNRGADVARSSPARTIPGPRARCTPPKGDRQGVRPVLRAPSMTDTRRLAAQRCLHHRPLPGRHQHLPLVLRLRAHPLTPAIDKNRRRHRARGHRLGHLLECPQTCRLEVVRLLAQPPGGNHDQVMPPGQQLEQLDRRQRLRRWLGRSGGAVRRANSAARIGSSPATLANSARSNPSFLR